MANFSHLTGEAVSAWVLHQASSQQDLRTELERQVANAETEIRVSKDLAANPMRSGQNLYRHALISQVQATIELAGAKAKLQALNDILAAADAIS